MTKSSRDVESLLYPDHGDLWQQDGHEYCVVLDTWDETVVITRKKHPNGKWNIEAAEPISRRVFREVMEESPYSVARAQCLDVARRYLKVAPPKPYTEEVDLSFIDEELREPPPRPPRGPRVGAPQAVPIPVGAPIGQGQAVNLGAGGAVNQVQPIGDLQWRVINPREMEAIQQAQVAAAPADYRPYQAGIAGAVPPRIDNVAAEADRIIRDIRLAAANRAVRAGRRDRD